MNFMPRFTAAAYRQRMNAATTHLVWLPPHPVLMRCPPATQTTTLVRTNTWGTLMASGWACLRLKLKWHQLYVKLSKIGPKQLSGRSPPPPWWEGWKWQEYLSKQHYFIWNMLLAARSRLIELASNIGPVSVISSNVKTIIIAKDKMRLSLRWWIIHINNSTAFLRACCRSRIFRNRAVMLQLRIWVKQKSAYLTFLHTPSLPRR